METKTSTWGFMERGVVFQQTGYDLYLSSRYVLKTNIKIGLRGVKAELEVRFGKFDSTNRNSRR